MSDDALIAMAEAAGVAPRWSDVHGQWHDVAPDTLRSVLAASGLPASTNAELKQSRSFLDRAAQPPLVTAALGAPVHVWLAPGRFEVRHEDGGVSDGTLGEDGMLPAFDATGYHVVRAGEAEVTVAVAPARCFTVQDAAPGRRPWALAAQIYSLRRPGDSGLGDFAALADFVRSAAGHGASAVAISPVHAQFSADPHRFSPYSPSSRLQLNVLHAAPPLTSEPALESASLVDWPRAAAVRHQALSAAYDAMDAAQEAEFAHFRAELGDTLETHARFEALHAHHVANGHWHWREWPAEHRDPRNPAVEAFARAHHVEVVRHAFLQFLADRDLGAAQRAARDAGMPIGLIADLAVGADSGGSHCWARQPETLNGLTIGAPPDLLSPQGQSWGLSAFSPRGLVAHGFAAYLEMLRAAMRHAGGVRIDHAMGLTRLWVVPDGASAKDGAYIRFPLTDMLRLIALESVRHESIVLGEDLGTVPDGFADEIGRAGILGMRVLWFERSKDNRFTSPGRWTPGAAGMTSTHDLATVAGWWQGRDIAARAVANPGNDVAHEEWVRGEDRAHLWRAMQESGAAKGDAPPPIDPSPVVDAAVRHVATAACDLVVLPLEDAVGTVEQPNLPGTLDEHPNWRRRFVGPAATMLDVPEVAARLADLDRIRASSHAKE